MITLKHFAQHWEVSPAKLRRLFRKEYPEKENGRWEFEHNSQSLTDVLAMLSRKLGAPTGSCAALSQVMHSAATSPGSTRTTSSSTKTTSTTQPSKKRSSQGLK